MASVIVKNGNGCPDPRPAPKGRRGENCKRRATSQRTQHRRAATTMNSSFHPGESSTHPFREPAPLPTSIPKVDEVGATSAPLKSAAFFIGAYCKEFNGGLDTPFILRDHLILTKIPHQKMRGSCRGLYALQGGESRPSSLSEGGSTGN